MERQKKIELLKSLKGGSRPAKEVIEILKGDRIEVDSLFEALEITSRPENFKEKSLIATGEMKKILEQVENQSTRKQ